eukprot:CAMPEP_0198541004 /NCGR_PEP_ID=MMETSP1462-20131121/53515_1 /TAXON_ID=1333877 /ORGANISM="Brandtodinium nutriculum, Strain RCC3387" /LENGTH=477 /DNA_ID=CAMNT_0044271147 /DNA_START=20 /DNA_END=1450 /DNA_ORIENTATION=-
MEKVAVTGICWVPRGKIAMRRPQPGGEDDDDLRAMHDELAGGGSSAGASGSSSAVAHAAAAASAITEGLEEFDLDNYDADEDNQDGMQFFSVFKNDGELADEKDPYMKGDADSESEDGFDEIKPDDQVFVAVSCEEDTCQLEVFVYDEEDASMYVHHDVQLTAYPLCVEWFSCIGEANEGSFGAVGLIDHSIQLWDLQEMEPMEPVKALGKAPKNKASKLKKKRVGASALSSAKAHEGPVLCLHGSVFNRNVLASGSADETLKVWDVSENKCVHTYSHHTSKVQCARWHPTEQAVLLSAAFDRKLAFLDVRQPGQVAMTELPAEAESAIWSRHAPFECLASVDNGVVACYDVRKVVGKGDGAKLWTLMAHDVACTAVQDAPTKGVLVTAGLDGHAKVWNTTSSPSLAMSKDLKAGPLFTCHSCPEAQALMCFGGKCPVMWDLSSEQILVDAFGFAPEVALQGREAKSGCASMVLLLA